VTPVKTGVHPQIHPNPINLDTVFQRYDGRLSLTPMLGFAGITLPRQRGSWLFSSKKTLQFETVVARGASLDCYRITFA
jgi:hypothetical protein